MALAEKNSPYRTAVRSVFFFLMMYYSFYVILTAANGVTMMSKLMVQYVTASYGKAYFGYAMALEFITLPLYFIGALASFAGYRLKELGRRGILFVTIFLMIFIPVAYFYGRSSCGPRPQETTNIVKHIPSTRYQVPT
jgi:hypothetical protein